MTRSIGASIVLALAVAVALCACGGNGGNSAAPVSPPPEVSSGVPAPGGGLTIEEALTTDAQGPLLVKGSLVVTGDQARLCSALAESFPPQCGGASLVVENLDLATIEGLTTEGDVSWTDAEVSLIGDVADGVLTVNPLAT